jgi:hypothetical protein
MPKRSDPGAKFGSLTISFSLTKSLEFSFLTQNASSDFVILEENKTCAGGSVWRGYGCKGTFDHTGVPTYCTLCWKMASEVKRREGRRTNALISFGSEYG